MKKEIIPNENGFELIPPTNKRGSVIITLHGIPFFKTFDKGLDQYYTNKMAWDVIIDRLNGPKI